VIDPGEPDPGKRAQQAVKISSWNDFRLRFGGFLPYSYLAYAVRGFFATGGKTCYVARVGIAANPPATAIMPLPAAVSSTPIAHFASATGPEQIALDAPVTLGIGDVLLVGDAAVNSNYLTVTGIIDSQTIAIRAADTSTFAVGQSVYRIYGPGLTQPFTTLTRATSQGQTQIELDSSDVVAQGDLIAIGDPVYGECVSVAGVIDDQVITVEPPLESAFPLNTLVYPVSGSALTADCDAGASTIPVFASSAFIANDLVIVEGGGVSEVRVVVALPGSASIQLGAPLKFAYSAGAVVRKYTAAFSVSAASPGSWGNRVAIEIVPLDPGNSVTHFAMRVTVDRGADSAQPIEKEFYPLLSLDPYDPSPTPIYAPTVVNRASQLIQLSPACPAKIAPGTKLLVTAGPLKNGTLYLEGGSDGTSAAAAAPAVEAVSGNPCQADAAQAQPSRPVLQYPPPPNATTTDFQNALDVLGLVDEIAILCCPDAVGPPPGIPTAGSWSLSAIQNAMLEQCTRLRYRVAVLDTPQFQSTGAPMQPATAVNWLKSQGLVEPAARFAAYYYPWLKVPDDLGIEGINRTVPACGHVAGAYAYNDNQSGVQKPPANIELEFVSDLQLTVSPQQQGFLNPAGINAIRFFPGRGIRVWGARSVSQNQNWQYIHRRRLMAMIEDSVEQATRWIVFQNNDDDLRRMVTHSLNVFLESIWRTGGLQGAYSNEGYFVKCDSTNNTPATIDAGQFICQVGVAIAAPMEFLVFEMRRSVAGAQVVEA
jgi:uncharacterized protein